MFLRPIEHNRANRTGFVILFNCETTVLCCTSGSVIRIFWSRLSLAKWICRSRAWSTTITDSRSGWTWLHWQVRASVSYQLTTSFQSPYGTYADVYSIWYDHDTTQITTFRRSLPDRKALPFFCLFYQTCEPPSSLGFRDGLHHGVWGRGRHAGGKLRSVNKQKYTDIMINVYDEQSISPLSHLFRKDMHIPSILRCLYGRWRRYSVVRAYTHGGLRSLAGFMKWRTGASQIPTFICI